MVERINQYLYLHLSIHLLQDAETKNKMNAGKICQSSDIKKPN